MRSQSTWDGTGLRRLRSEKSSSLLTINHAVLQRVLPDRAIVGRAQTHLAHRDRFLSEFAEQPRERRRKLCIDKEFHATLSTEWSAWAAAYCRHALMSPASKSG